MKTNDLLELYRAKAQEAEENAAMTQDADVREKLLRIAEGFRNLLAHHQAGLRESSIAEPRDTSKLIK